MIAHLRLNEPFKLWSILLVSVTWVVMSTRQQQLMAPNKSNANVSLSGVRVGNTSLPISHSNPNINNSHVNMTEQQQHTTTVKPSNQTSLDQKRPEQQQQQQQQKVEVEEKLQFTSAGLESALNIKGIKCGTVPIYEKLYRRSINESFNENPDDGDFRILHGLDSMTGEWPWIVRITACEKENKCGTCTGTLLNSRWFISAGHCGNKQIPVDKYTATIGLYDLVSPDNTSFDVAIDRLIVHPEYKDLTNDLTLFRLAKPVNFTDYVQPACLIRATRNVLAYTKNRNCYTVGYGFTEGMMEAVRLQKLRIVAKEPSECNSDTLGSVQLKRGTLCIGPLDGQIGGACKGDSGGPDLCYDPKAGQWVIFGIVSYGPSDCDRDTGDKWLTVSVDLSNYRTWILSTILANQD